MEMTREEIEKEIAEAKAWIEENPCYFDGLAEKRAYIRYLEKILLVNDKKIDKGDKLCIN